MRNFFVTNQLLSPDDRRMYEAVISEDVQIVREAIENQVNWKSHVINLAGSFPNGEKALNYMMGNPVDLLITDIRMPKLDGLALIKEGKQLYPGLQVILVSAYNDFEYARKALRYGAVDFISKPVNFTELDEAVKKAVSRLCGGTRLKRQQTMVQHLLKA